MPTYIVHYAIMNTVADLMKSHWLGTQSQVQACKAVTTTVEFKGATSPW